MVSKMTRKVLNSGVI